MKSEAFLMDCMEGMKNTPDNYYDLAVVDPPYGIGYDGARQTSGSHGGRKAHKFKGWDTDIPTEDYFKELYRVSKNQMIWGANYMVEYLKPSMGWVVWYKGQEGLTMSDAELAFSSFDRATRVVKINRVELLKDGTIHPTQKPVALYDWIFAKYATPGMKILDTHLGSGSSRIAAYKAKLDFTGYEIDPEYFEAQEKRFQTFIAQGTLF